MHLFIRFSFSIKQQFMSSITVGSVQVALKSNWKPLSEWHDTRRIYNGKETMYSFFALSWLDITARRPSFPQNRAPSLSASRVSFSPERTVHSRTSSFGPVNLFGSGSAQLIPWTDPSARYIAWRAGVLIVPPGYLIPSYLCVLE